MYFQREVPKKVKVFNVKQSEYLMWSRLQEIVQNGALEMVLSHTSLHSFLNKHINEDAGTNNSPF